MQSGGPWVFVIIGLALGYLTLTARRRAILARIDAIDDNGAFLPRELFLQRSFVERSLKPLIASLSQMGERLTPQGQIARLREKLTHAGYPGKGPLQSILALKVFSLVLGGLIFALLVSFGVKPNLGVAFCSLIWVFGMIAPEKWLDHRILRRRVLIARALPEVLDLITGCVECGLSFDSAIQRITERPAATGEELRSELARYLNDIRLGHCRSEALVALERRCDLYEMKGIIAALLQADQLGVGVGNILRSQSVFLRNNRRQKAQEAAMKIPVKMLFPLVFCIFPVTFLVILGPAMLRIMAAIPQMIGGG